VWCIKCWLINCDRTSICFQARVKTLSSLPSPRWFRTGPHNPLNWPWDSCFSVEIGQRVTLTSHPCNRRLRTYECMRTLLWLPRKSLWSCLINPSDNFGSRAGSRPLELEVLLLGRLRVKRRTDNGIQSHSVLDNYLSDATSFRLVCLINVPHSTDDQKRCEVTDYSCQITPRP
jgi:hypothetical protein